MCEKAINKEAFALINTRIFFKEYKKNKICSLLKKVNELNKANNAELIDKFFHWRKPERTLALLRSCLEHIVLSLSSNMEIKAPLAKTQKTIKIGELPWIIPNEITKKMKK